MTHIGEEQMTVPYLHRSTNASSNSQMNLIEALQAHGLQLEEHGDNHVVWGSENPDHPHNWSQWTTAYDVAIIVAWESFAYVIMTN